jgi:trimethylamine:corrinoid methyltransferase-like protein
LFSKKMSKGFGLHPLPETPNGVLVSEPERALLEMLSEVGVHQGVEEARNIMEGARSLRTATLATLLKHCQRVKVRLLCVQWAEELNLPWASAARTAAGTRHGQSRWTARLKNGTVLNIKP